jgi:hypothetical protein
MHHLICNPDSGLGAGICLRIPKPNSQWVSDVQQNDPKLDVPELSVSMVHPQASHDGLAALGEVGNQQSGAFSCLLASVQFTLFLSAKLAASICAKR